MDDRQWKDYLNEIRDAARALIDMLDYLDANEGHLVTLEDKRQRIERLRAAIAPQRLEEQE